MTEIALFPIPDCVSFPKTLFPLHVFEPRYRDMVHQCLERRMLLGICHTRKVLRPAPEGQSLEDALQSNQATYVPYDVFSAGYCQLQETLDDGRMLLQVELLARYRTVRELQTLPFRISECEEVQDEPPGQAEIQETAVLRDKILHRLQAMATAIPELRILLATRNWEELDPLLFSFCIFGQLRFAPELQQQILEMTSPRQRLARALEILNE